ncbi:Choline dehydrogenase, mitochondrial [Hondaea fermentalgiana]|uniref:Choline dehydrogenase, mitochondrial n=1 Tax=Hondaea fermentalgiana TaxID=2315210 RepID=A0A2R5GRH8_9STRA|nr:Choline dehydrogenase, mitochondrial [Hondaea fermentalgiana]|eukprot:GBG33482.1 Choline dehydrogenase, mitochondrial [Hondaea fermentalgiana]
MQGARRVEKIAGHLRGDSGGSNVDEKARRRGLQAQETAGLVDGGEILAEYDYIVVGAGSAGCVVASRLSEDPKVSVLLLEAGGNNQTFSVRHPLVTCATLQNSQYDWGFRSEPQQNQNERVSYWPRGKCLGGSSSINYMLYVRCDPRNYDQYANEFGCEGWSYKEVLPFFRKSENLITSQKMDPTHHSDEYRSRKGPLKVIDLSDPHFEFQTKYVSECFVSACNEKGIQGPHDFNSGKQDGANLAQVSVADGKRSDTASMFLFETGALKRPNLTVMTHAHVQKLVTQGDLVTGVVFKAGDHDMKTLRTSAVPSRFVAARKEVVISAGAVGTPQILMLSGIGPHEELEQLGIPCIADLPVGRNMSDHLMCPLPYAVKDHAPGFSGSFMEIAQGFWDYYVKGQGIFSFPFITAMAFFRSGIRPEEDGNDLQIHFTPYTMDDHELLKRNFGTDITHPRFQDELPPKRVMFIPSLVRPKSKGSVTLRSACPFDAPRIEPNYLDHEDDMEMFLHCYRKCMEIAETSEAFKDVLGERIVNAYSEYDPNSDEYIREELRETSVTIYHPVGTAKMGRVEDPTTVVDAKTLKVKGFLNLRVADASIFPEVPSGNTNAPAIMAGERVAHMIASSSSSSSSPSSSSTP